MGRAPQLNVALRSRKALSGNVSLRFGAFCCGAVQRRYYLENDDCRDDLPASELTGRTHKNIQNGFDTRRLTPVTGGWFCRRRGAKERNCNRERGANPLRPIPRIIFCHCRVECKSGRIRCMKSQNTITAIIAALSVSLARADDFKTIDGKEYKNATVSRVEADGLLLKTKGGISKVYFTELPKDVQERFHYDPAQATAAQAASVRQTQELNQFNSQQEELAKQRKDEQLNQEGKLLYAQALMNRLVELQQEEENLLARIGQLENRGSVSWSSRGTQGSVHVYANDPAKADLPLLRGRLANVREEKQKVTAELNRARRESR
jgi:hypothetical protein